MTFMCKVNELDHLRHRYNQESLDNARFVWERVSKFCTNDNDVCRRAWVDLQRCQNRFHGKK